MMGPGNTAAERELLHIFRELGAGDRASLKAFAAFLLERAKTARAEADAEVLMEAVLPKDIPRPEFETVIGAIKRLSETYYMLDRSRMLEDTSSLMTGHLLQGRDAMAVIDELEQLFQRHFDKYKGS
jgi:hypothetical protein